MSNQERLFVASSFIDGEGHEIWTAVTEEQMNKVQEILGHDFMDDISLEHSFELKEITIEQSVESQLAGATMDGCYKKSAQIRYMLDNGVTNAEEDLLKSKYPAEYEAAISADSLESIEEND